MTVQTTDTGALLLFSAAELQAEAIAPEHLTADQALSLIRHSYRLAGLELPPAVEIETYPAAHALLLFVRPRPAWAPCRPLLFS